MMEGSTTVFPDDSSTSIWLGLRTSRMMPPIGRPAKANGGIGSPDLGLKAFRHPGTMEGLPPRSAADHSILPLFGPVRVAIGTLCIIFIRVSVRHPFSHVSRHIVQAVRTAARFELSRGS